MDREVLERALKEVKTLNDMRVLLAMGLGHLDTYDIQQATGLQKVRVEASVQIARPILRIEEVLNKPILEEAVQIAQAPKRIPPLRVLDYLHSRLNRPLTYTAQEQAAAKTVYARAYEFAHRDQNRAIELIEDCIEAYMSEEYNRFRTSSKPALTLQKQISTYLAALPDKTPLHIWEAERTGKRFRYNHIIDKWELRNDRRVPAAR